MILNDIDGWLDFVQESINTLDTLRLHYVLNTQKSWPDLRSWKNNAEFCQWVHEHLVRLRIAAIDVSNLKDMAKAYDQADQVCGIPIIHLKSNQSLSDALGSSVAQKISSVHRAMSDANKLT